MFQSLYKYLIVNSKAALPGIGVFHIRRQPAYLDFSKKTFIAPSAHVVFTVQPATADKKFLSFLSKEQHIEEPEAIQHFNHFTQALKENLRSSGRAELPGFGVLSKDDTGVIHFQQAKPLYSFYDDVAAERTIREVLEKDMVTNTKDSQISKVVSDAKNSANRKDYWWVFAIILAAAAIAAIIYYYLQNGSLR